MGYRSAFCKKLLEAFSRPKEPISAISKSGLPLAKTEPISNHGSMSRIKNVGQKVLLQLQLEREVRICDSNNSAHNKVSGEGRGGGTGAEIPLQLVVKTMGRQAVCKLTEIHVGMEIHLQAVKDLTPKQVDAQRRS